MKRPGEATAIRGQPDAVRRARAVARIRPELASPEAHVRFSGDPCYRKGRLWSLSPQHAGAGTRRQVEAEFQEGRHAPCLNIV